MSGKLLNKKTILNSCFKALPSTIEKRLFNGRLICPFHRKAIIISLSTQRTILNYGTNDSQLHKKTFLLQPSRQLFQAPQGLKSRKRKEYSNRKLIGDSTVDERKPGHVKCKLEVGFPPLVERYISVLTLVPPNLVVSECTQGELFNYMKTVWRFSPGLKGYPQTSIVDIHIAFEFRSTLHSQLSTMFFDEVAKKMVGAFEKRCEVLYGPSSLKKSRRKRSIGTRNADPIGQ